MCCIISALFLIGPRGAIFFWWLIEPARWAATFDTFIGPALGFLFLPWTTLMYVIVFPGGATGLDFVWLALAVAMDIFTWAGGGLSGRNRMQATAA